jgi:hypothetical protein
MSDYVTSDQFNKFLKEETDHHTRNEAAGAKRGQQIDKILEKQGEMQTSIDSLYRWRKETDKASAAQSGEIKELRKTMFGNGIPGWDEMIRAMYEDYKDRQKEKEEARKANAKLDKETTLTKVKMSGEAKIAAIGGAFMLVSSILSALIALWLGK